MSDPHKVHHGNSPHPLSNDSKGAAYRDKLLLPWPRYESLHSWSRCDAKKKFCAGKLSRFHVESRIAASRQRRQTAKNRMIGSNVTTIDGKMQSIYVVECEVVRY
jgi:hypothetical protein